MAEKKSSANGKPMGLEEEGRDEASRENLERLTELEEDNEHLRDQLLRRTAEMENMRRRFQQEREVLIAEGNKRLINDLLNTLDDLERTLEHSSKGQTGVLEGVELVYKNFLKTLERYGVRPMQSLDQPFDVNLHDALMEEVRTDVDPGTVVREIQKGYYMNDSILRHAKVIVSKEPDFPKDGKSKE